ncbi:MAG: PH domain-containing protein [Bacilli bacterium]|nr:PH domain-containing protein [Bacilli bacterium]
MTKNIVYTKVKDFLKRNPGTIAWRVRAHAKVADMHINDDEEVLYAFAAQKGPSALDIFSTHVLAVTNKRLIVAQKRLVFGYFYYSITPDMFNDFTIKMGLIWGRAIIDTIKETVVLSNLSSGALKEVETVLTKYMMQKKRELENGLSDEEQNALHQNLEDISKKGER